MPALQEARWLRVVLDQLLWIHELNLFWKLQIAIWSSYWELHPVGDTFCGVATATANKSNIIAWYLADLHMKISQNSRNNIGNLGWTMQEAGVQNVTVTTTMFKATENGVRIKTWARESNGFVRGVVFEHLTMVAVENPVIIDQQYCPDESG
ncbi:hypothetical protein L6452_15281 [Arctium lappa]|uniref:Uncharacterized protein n=1 Tax=Arctium lappa TaxID=4217 RepID=A0ACB9CNK6_ARCLA|nr:hypothetical protein L6452_15281 [Arctium lappa]